MPFFHVFMIAAVAELHYVELSGPYDPLPHTVVPWKHDASLPAGELVQHLVDSRKVVVFTRSSTSTSDFDFLKQELLSLGIPFTVVDFSNHSYGWQLQAAVVALANSTDLPSTFVSGQHFGDPTKLATALRSGLVEQHAIGHFLAGLILWHNITQQSIKPKFPLRLK